MRRSILRLGLALATAGLLAGCASPLPVAQPEAVPAQALPALDTGQVARVLAGVSSSLAGADAEALSAVALGDKKAVTQALDKVDAELAVRLGGPAAEMRRAEYVLATKGGADAITEVPTGAQTVIDPATDTWPRVLMVVTPAPEDLRAPLLLTLEQTSPRAPYRLMAWARLFGGVTMPATMQASVGSDPVPADGGSALLPPKQVVSRYVDLLTSGADSAFADEFTQDTLRVRIAEQLKAWKAAVGKGSVTETYAPVAEGPWALGTADGGAIVVGTIRTVTTLTLVDSTLTIGDETAALLGASTVKKSLAITWLSTVAFSVPPAGSSDPIAVLGAEHIPVEVTGS
jgi:hypothetical protein